MDCDELLCRAAKCGMDEYGGIKSSETIGNYVQLWRLAGLA